MRVRVEVAEGSLPSGCQRRKLVKRVVRVEPRTHRIVGFRFPGVCRTDVAQAVSLTKHRDGLGHYPARNPAAQFFPHPAGDFVEDVNGELLNNNNNNIYVFGENFTF